MPRQREGSPFTGLSTVTLKEAADHMTSARIHLVMLLILLTAIGAVYAAISESIPKAVRLVIRSSEILATGKRSGMAGFLVGDGQKSDALLRVPLAREIIDLHGGLISGESAEQRFIVVLPSAV